VCYWVAVKCAPQKETVTAQRLRGIGCLIYLPLARTRPRGALKPTILPFYRTYLFADIDEGPPSQRINRTAGVFSVLLTGDQPSRRPACEIEKLRMSEVDGIVHWPMNRRRRARRSSRRVKR
jgi:hypothetical protein